MLVPLGLVRKHSGIDSPHFAPCRYQKAFVDKRFEVLGVIYTVPWCIWAGVLREAGQEGRQTELPFWWKKVKHSDLNYLTDFSRARPPPPPTRMHEGAACVCPFLWRKEGVFGVLYSLGRFPEKAWKGGVFVTANGNHYPRYGVYLFRVMGFRVMGNKHRYPLILWSVGAD